MNYIKKAIGRVQRLVTGRAPSLTAKDSSVGEGASPLPDRRCPMCHNGILLCLGPLEEPYLDFCDFCEGTGERRRRVSGNGGAHTPEEES